MANFAQNLLSGMALGRERRLQDEAIAKQNRLGQLAGDAFAAAPDQRGGILAEIARLDPQSAFAMQGTFDAQAQRAEAGQQAKLGNMAKLLSVAPAQARGGLYARMRPGLQAMGFDAPEQWSDDLLPVVQALGGQDQGAQSAQRAYVEWMASQLPEDRRGEFMLTQAGLLPKVDNPTYSVQRVENADGSFSFVQVPTRGGRVVGASGAVPAPAAAPRPSGATGAPNMDTILTQANIMAQQGVPDAQIEEFIARAAQQQGVQVTPATMDDRANGTLDAQTYGTSPAGAAAPRGQATNATRAAAEAEAAAARERATVLARAEAERIASEPQRQRANKAVADKIDAVGPVLTEALDQVSGWTAGVGSWLGVLPGTTAKDLQRNLETLQARLSFDELAKMRAASPTGGALGAVSERELVLLGATVRSIEQDQSPAQLRRNLEAIKYHYDRWLMTTRGINPDDQQSSQPADDDVSDLLEIY